MKNHFYDTRHLLLGVTLSVCVLPLCVSMTPSNFNKKGIDVTNATSAVVKKDSGKFYNNSFEFKKTIVNIPNGDQYECSSTVFFYLPTANKRLDSATVLMMIQKINNTDEQRPVCNVNIEEYKTIDFTNDSTVFEGCVGVKEEKQNTRNGEIMKGIKFRVVLMKCLKCGKLECTPYY